MESRNRSDVAAAHAGSGLARQVPGDQLVGVAAVARGPDEALCGGEAKRDAAVDHALAVHRDVRLEPGTLLVDHHRVREAHRDGRDRRRFGCLTAGRRDRDQEDEDSSKCAKRSSDPALSTSPRTPIGHLILH